MKVIIAGSGKLTHYPLIPRVVELSGWRGFITEVVSGTAAGIDSLAIHWAEREGISVHREPAAWADLTHPDAVIKRGRYGAYDALAGFRRNEVMADYADGLIAVWNGFSNGTRHMIQTMRARKKPIFGWNLAMREWWYEFPTADLPAVRWEVAA